ncbi:MAG: tRNA pseudouridine(55) synthase TruB [Pelagibacteraceae bacterium]|jgi:tRNA pseudouridine55 synthase|nr:tRNA pseudouridine(55) synthase TruB [Pelagibacteraceae bacterium]MBT3902089.1 tRNA pseudouridine(55) synthase TruB [Pelagibacteraceae bacterium]MBT4645327.1 tRNA pseudouridine(55) synthase TruB [Pelagibacteraceae bacterium]MBT5213294.1 tRNA pseudouridine(55) synthase TruB [Pelagibacteraceae bacterium]MBT6354764.1 tRNA pseudouridine(55) synthase TruB [Pelagibacteraceae bacterium]
MNEKIQGWLNLYKPPDISSFSAIYKVKKKFNIKKLGHGGTLDPNAEGVLPIAINKTTKLIPFINSNSKKYIFRIKWREQTSTDDAEGEILNVSNKIPDEDEINKIIFSFLGQVDQVPPKASAIKVNGKRAYSILRDKKNFTLRSKKVFLKEILFLGSNKDTSEFMIECGKGYYVRSLARDIALKLGTFGHVVELKRTKVGNFVDKTSILLDDLLKIGQREFEFNYIHSSISMLDDILAYEIKEKTDLIDLSLGKAIFINHKLINKPLNSDKKELVFLSYRGSVVSFGKLSGDLFQPNKVLI